MVILIILVVFVGGILASAATKPGHFRYERSILIMAPPERVFPYLNNTRKASEWSPWEKNDPGMAKSYSGPEEGVGAIFTWNGNNKVGAGRLEITDSVPAQRVGMTLDFLRPMKSHQQAEYILEVQPGGTLVTWATYGPNPFMGKLISVFINCRKMCEREFDKGLASLKDIVEVKDV